MRRRQRKQGTIRRRSGFLFFPKVIDKELRWFELATWEEMFYPYLPYGDTIGGFWSPTRWVDD